MNQTTPQGPKWTDFETFLQDITKGTLLLPNAEELDPRAGINYVCLGNTELVIGNRRVFLTSPPLSTWARYFVSRTQAGHLDGTGICFTYGMSYLTEPPMPTGKVFKFAICKHEHVKGADARPNFGWHPSHCSKCGLDTSVDSGD